jgi:hypothetical protein
VSNFYATPLFCPRPRLKSPMTFLLAENAFYGSQLFIKHPMCMYKQYHFIYKH